MSTEVNKNMEEWIEEINNKDDITEKEKAALYRLVRANENNEIVENGPAGEYINALLKGIRQFDATDSILMKLVNDFCDLMKGIMDVTRKIQSNDGKEERTLIRRESLDGMYMYLAKIVWHIASKNSKSENDVAWELTSFSCYFMHKEKIEKVPKGLVAISHLFRTYFKDDIDCSRLIWLGRWASYGFPLVKIGDKLAAALIFTDLPDNYIDRDLNPPWNAFRISIPGNILPGVQEDGEEYLFDTISVFRHIGEDDTRWSLLLTGMGTAAPELLRGVQSLSELAHNFDGNEDDNSFLRIRLTTGDIDQTQDDMTKTTASALVRRLLSAAGRLVIGIILRMMDSDSFHKRTAKASGQKRRIGGPPQAAEWLLGGEVKIDCREAVRGFILGKKGFKYNKVQWLVRGHWRNQPYGKERKLYRRQWIEPFWKGPEKAPILIKSHSIQDETSQE